MPFLAEGSPCDWSCSQSVTTCCTQTKLDHCQLPMLKKRRLEVNAFMFHRKAFIRLQKELRSLPRQLHSNSHCSCKLHLERVENICVHNPVHKIYHPRENRSYCPKIKELTWDTSSTENFWLDVHSYKDPIGNIPFQLLCGMNEKYKCVLY